MNIHLSNTPGRSRGEPPRAFLFWRKARRPYLVLHRSRFTEPPRSPATLVGSYPTVSPSPHRRSEERRGQTFLCGTVSGSPQAAVNSRPALWCPDFPPSPSIQCRSVEASPCCGAAGNRQRSSEDLRQGERCVSLVKKSNFSAVFGRRRVEVVKIFCLSLASTPIGA